MQVDKAHAEAIRILTKEAGYIDDAVKKERRHVYGPDDYDKAELSPRHAHMKHYSAHLCKIVDALREMHPFAIEADGYNKGVQQGLRVAALTLADEGTLDTAHKIYHFLQNNGTCQCRWDAEGIHDNDCDDFRSNAAKYFMDLYGMSPEEYEAQQRFASAAEVARREEEALAHARQRRLALRELAVEQGIDPNLLP
jgi:hypothetical protein